jgi:O-antigen/teichoic acid export membrane protein
MVLIQTLLFAVSRPMSAEYPTGLPSYDGLRRRGFRVALIAGGLVAAILFFGAGPIAGFFLDDPALAEPLRIVAPIPLIYAVYAVNVGTLNAIRRFQLQATLDIVMAASKAALIIGAAALGYGLAHILGGFTLASLLVLALSIVFVIISRPADSGGGARARCRAWPASPPCSPSSPPASTSCRASTCSCSSASPPPRPWRTRSASTRAPR